MHKDKLKKLAERVRLQVSDRDLESFGKSFSNVSTMIEELLNEKIADDISEMERITLAPLGMEDLMALQSKLSSSVLSKEEIAKNTLLKGSKIIISKKHD